MNRGIIPTAEFGQSNTFPLIHKYNNINSADIPSDRLLGQYHLLSGSRIPPCPPPLSWSRILVARGGSPLFLSPPLLVVIVLTLVLALLYSFMLVACMLHCNCMSG